MSYELKVDLKGVPGKVVGPYPATRSGGPEEYVFEFKNSNLRIDCDKEGRFGRAGCSYGGDLSNEIFSYCPNGTRYRSDDDKYDEWWGVDMDDEKRARWRLRHDLKQKEREQAELEAGNESEAEYSLENLAAVSQQTVASDLDRPIQSHQQAAADVSSVARKAKEEPARPHKPWWRFW
jgi:hypothetical protein